MLDTLFPKHAKEARAVLLWVVLSFAAVGVSGVVAFFFSLSSGLVPAFIALQVRQVVTVLWIGCTVNAFLSLHLAWRIKKVGKVAKIAEAKPGEAKGAQMFLLPSDLSLLIDSPGDVVRAILEAETFESKDAQIWKDLLGIYSRAPYKGVEEYNQVRTYLLGETRKLESPKEIMWSI